MSEPITNVEDAVRVLGALPVLVGPEPQALALPWAHAMSDDDLHDFLGDLVSAAMGRWQSSPEVPDRTVLANVEKACAGWRSPGQGYRSDESEVDALLARVAELEAERHSTNEALDDAVQELRVRESADRLTQLLAPTQALREEGACTECGDGPSQWCPGCAKCRCVAEHDMGCARRAGGVS